MQKPSETVYSSLFWLISGLLVWLVIVPVTFICLPVIILVKVASWGLSNKVQLNLGEVKPRSQANSSHKSDQACDSLITTVLLKTLIEVPAVLAAVISLQPARLMNGNHKQHQTLGSQSTIAPEESIPQTMEVSAEE